MYCILLYMQLLQHLVVHNTNVVAIIHPSVFWLGNYIFKMIIRNVSKITVNFVRWSQHIIIL